MSSMITYDVTKKHTAIKAALSKKGYHDYWRANGKTYYLPNTSLWKKGVSTATALHDLKKVILEINIKRLLH